MPGYIERAANQVADILMREGLDYTQTKAVFKQARAKAGLHAPNEHRGSPARLTLEEELRFIDQAYAQSGQVGLMMQVLLETGARVSEFVALRVEDVRLASADDTTQRVIGGGENALLLEPGAAAGQESRGAVEPQCLSLEKLLKVVPGHGIEGTQAQVVTHVLLMLGNGLAALGAGVDRFQRESQLQGGEAQDLAVDLQRNLPRVAPEDADKGNLIGEAQSVVGPTSLGNLAPFSFEEAAIADQTGGDRCRDREGGA